MAHWQVTSSDRENVVPRVETSNGRQVGYHAQGEGRPVVFLHSGPGSAADWRQVFAAFSEGYRLVAMNAFGRGETADWPEDELTVDDFVGLVGGLTAALGGTFDLVGHSYGGAIALRTAVVAPELVGTLTVLEPQIYPVLEDSDPRLYAQGIELLDRFTTALTAGRPEVAWRAFIDHYNEPGTWDSLPAGLRNLQMASSKGAVRSWEALYANPTSIDDLTGIPHSTLVIQGSQTAAAEERMCEIVADAVPQARRIVIDGAGHMLPLTHPAAVAAAIEEHLRAGERAER